MICLNNLKAVNSSGISNSYKNLMYFNPFRGKVQGDTFQKTPEYLYHFTNEETADEIIKSGKIDVSQDGIELNKTGVFMVDLKNLVDKWTKENIQANDGSFNLLTCLLGQTTKGSPKISCFKIPAERLNNDIFVRSQKDLMEAAETGLDPEFMTPENYKSSEKNDDPIEYLHCGKIPVSKDDLIGTVELPEVLQQFFEDCDFGESLSAYGKLPDKASMDVVEELFKNEPEIKDIKDAK